MLVEPIAANMGLVAPAAGFLAGSARALHRSTARCSCSTRSSPASGSGSAARRRGFAIAPDLSIFGKVVGGGLPLAAVGGPAAVMDELAPLGPVYQAGTLSGNPLATAAGLAALARPRRRRLRRRSKRPPSGSPRVCAMRSRRRRRRRRSPRAFTLVGVFFAAAPVRNYDDARARRPRALRRLLPRPARSGRVLRAERLRDAVPEPRPHRRRHRSHRRRRRRELAARLIASASRLHRAPLARIGDNGASLWCGGRTTCCTGGHAWRGE